MPIGTLGALNQAIIEHEEHLARGGVVDLRFDVVVAEALIHKFSGGGS
jgi:hypothetical protein